MNASQMDEAAKRLEASGIRFLRPVIEGARIIEWAPVDPTAALGRIMAAWKWRIELGVPGLQVTDLNGLCDILDRMQGEVREPASEVARRRWGMGDRQITDDRPRNPEVAGPTVHSDHASEATSDDHRDVTGGSPNA